MKSKLAVLLHCFQHHFGWYPGHVEIWWEGEKLQVGYQCDECGKMSGIDDVPEHIVYPKGVSSITASRCTPTDI